ncbi:YkoF-like protein [Linnemannia elongata AG-77]|uniref:YkoF-like protein n=1 Tax=Linnemannia elongata AG-77 TaxID=1314771 RepID=A0A197K9M8_9FUNG|nr:YkoF-like protein [Linnemannia elongata AG-77]
MSQPEQQLYPLDHKEDQKATSSTVGETISHLGEKLSGATLRGDKSSTGTPGLPSREEASVRCLADFAIYPVGTTASFQRHIDEVEKVLKRCGIDYKVHPQCTTMEGEMGAITYAIKACHEALHTMGCPRIASNVRFETGAENYHQLPREHTKEE